MKKFLRTAISTVALGLPSFVYAINVNTTNFGLNEFGNATNLGTNIELITTIARIVNILLGFLGVLAVVLILVAGFKWMTAAGNEEKIGEAKKLMGAGVIGLVIILAAFAIASFVINQLASSTGYNGYSI